MTPLAWVGVVVAVLYAAWLWHKLATAERREDFE